MENIEQKLRQLPIYELTIDDSDESGVSAVALVKNPAIEMDWFAFAENKQTFQFKSINDEKQLLAGYAMIPDKLIYRNMNGNEFFVVFKKDQIEKIAEKFNKNTLGKSFNIGHDANKPTNAFVKESWIVESEDFDKSKMFGFDAIVGGWFMITKVEDKATWEKVKAGELKGFSVEGDFSMQIEKFLSQIKFDKIGFDYDETLSTKRGQELAKEYLSKNDEVFIVTARNESTTDGRYGTSEVYAAADALGIPHSRVYFTNGKDKYIKIKELGLDKFYDNNPDQIELINKNTNTQGIKFKSAKEVYFQNLNKK